MSLWLAQGHSFGIFKSEMSIIYEGEEGKK